uniref:Uncharacterized protein n=1 Tax=Glycine max TaxID=3847 RepID=C6SZP6_SOYBN|nr:unknown [Glycine max]
MIPYFELHKSTNKRRRTIHQTRTSHPIVALDLPMVHHQAPLADCHMDILWVQTVSWRLCHSTQPTIPATRKNSIPHTARPMLHTFRQCQQYDLYTVREMQCRCPTGVPHSWEGVCREHSVCRRGGPCRSGGEERKQRIGKRRRFRLRSSMLRSSISLPWLMIISFS